ncbi:hypothetical protein KGF57_005154 [Candida theae]|uniref:Uncharacterized protein n=1 Tax=Candida theae TaxID=1198502 RepID=A0AAD5BA57_9ASCO|nr:uncharacterized protein KGF57_005154 [Candida theae]KAI5948756.1 hypothetical protein KGF57_005154 [Candida theae]
MKLSTTTLLLGLGSAGQINAETDTTITNTITITKTLYTPEESLSMAAEAAKAASIASVSSVESAANIAVAQSLAESYYSSLASASLALLAQETAALDSKGYNATNNLTIHYVTVTVKPKSKETSSAKGELVLDVSASLGSSSSNAITIPAEESSEDSGMRLLDGQYTGAVAGACALIAALL